MTTKDFIKMLQEADPEGTAHIRLRDGVPYHAERKPGYYDGPYSYINEEGKYVTTASGSKVDIYCKDPSSYVWNDEMDWNEFQEDPETAWMRLKSLFLFDFNTYVVQAQRQERIDSFYSSLREIFDEYVSYTVETNKKYLNEMISKYKDGWRFFQKKDAEMKFYDWKMMDEDGKIHGASWSMTGPILLSGRFSSIDRSDCLEWVLLEDFEKKKESNDAPKNLFQKEEKKQSSKKKGFWKRIFSRS